MTWKSVHFKKEVKMEKILIEWGVIPFNKDPKNEIKGTQRFIFRVIGTDFDLTKNDIYIDSTQKITQKKAMAIIYPILDEVLNDRI